MFVHFYLYILNKLDFRKKVWEYFAYLFVCRPYNISTDSQQLFFCKECWITLVLCVNFTKYINFIFNFKLKFCLTKHDSITWYESKTLALYINSFQQQKVEVVKLETNRSLSFVKLINPKTSREWNKFPFCFHHQIF